MPTTSGPVADPYEGFRELVSATTTFQRVADVADASEASAHVYWPEVKCVPTEEGEELPQRPYVIIRDDDSCPWSMNVNLRRAAGSLIMTFEFPVPISENPDEPNDIHDPAILAQFISDVGNILLEMCDLAGNAMNNPTGPWHWNITQITKHMTPGLYDHSENPEPGEEGEAFLAAAYKIDWI